MKCPHCGAENAPGMTDCGNCGHSLTAEVPAATERMISSDSIERLLLSHTVEIEDALRELKGLKGFLVRRLTLPSTTVYKSEVETVSHHINKEGKVSVVKGEMPEPRITIEGSHSSLCQLLTTWDRKLPASGDLKVTVSGRLLGKVSKTRRRFLVLVAGAATSVLAFLILAHDGLAGEEICLLPVILAFSFFFFVKKKL